MSSVSDIELKVEGWAQQEKGESEKWKDFLLFHLF